MAVSSSDGYIPVLIIIIITITYAVNRANKAGWPDWRDNPLQQKARIAKAQGQLSLGLRNSGFLL